MVHSPSLMTASALDHVALAVVALGGCRCAEPGGRRRRARSTASQGTKPRRTTDKERDHSNGIYCCQPMSQDARLVLHCKQRNR